MKLSEKSVHVLSRHLWLSKLGWDNSTYIEGIICPTQSYQNLVLTWPHIPMPKGAPIVQLYMETCNKLITSNVYLSVLSKAKHCQSPMPLLGFTGASGICLKKCEGPCFVQVPCTAVKPQVTDHESFTSRFTSCWFVHPLWSIFGMIQQTKSFFWCLNSQLLWIK